MDKYDEIAAKIGWHITMHQSSWDNGTIASILRSAFPAEKAMPMEMLKRLYQTNSSKEWVLIAKRDFGYTVTESGKEELK